MKGKIGIAQELIIKDLAIDEPGVVFSSLEKLKSWLSVEIGVLIDRDFQQLMNILYRIDVSEEKTKMAFADHDPSAALATLIIERELQKVASRERYKQNN